jgi:hypothetical protein
MTSCGSWPGCNSVSTGPIAHTEKDVFMSISLSSVVGLEGHLHFCGTLDDPLLIQYRGKTVDFYPVDTCLGKREKVL